MADVHTLNFSQGGIAGNLRDGRSGDELACCLASQLISPSSSDINGDVAHLATTALPAQRAGLTALDSIMARQADHEAVNER